MAAICILKRRLLVNILYVSLRSLVLKLKPGKALIFLNRLFIMLLFVMGLGHLELEGIWYIL